jgi:hypothetical protein
MLKVKAFDIYSEGARFESRPEHRHLCGRFFSVSSGKCRTYILKFGHEYFFPHNVIIFILLRAI